MISISSNLFTLVINNRSTNINYVNPINRLHHNGLHVPATHQVDGGGVQLPLLSHALNVAQLAVQLRQALLKSPWSAWGERER